MQPLLGVCDIMARYGCCRQTASKRMHEMQHMQNPLRVPEWAVTEWENAQMARKKAARRKGKIITLEEVSKHDIPRRRA